jgi:transcription initiation factor IIE alpha subunit
MKIHVTLRVDDKEIKRDVIEIGEHKLGELTDEEIEQAIEINIREWVNRAVSVEWEADENE